MTGRLLGFTSSPPSMGLCLNALLAVRPPGLLAGPSSALGASALHWAQAGGPPSQKPRAQRAWSICPGTRTGCTTWPGFPMAGAACGAIPASPLPGGPPPPSRAARSLSWSAPPGRTSWRPVPGSVVPSGWRISGACLRGSGLLAPRPNELCLYYIRILWCSQIKCCQKWYRSCRYRELNANLDLIYHLHKTSCQLLDPTLTTHQHKYNFHELPNNDQMNEQYCRRTS